MSETRAPIPSRFAQAPYLMLALTILSWGGNVVAAKASIGDISPMAMVSLRWLVVFALIFAWARGDAVHALADLRSHWRYTMIMGALGFTISNALFFLGANYTTGLNIAIIPGIGPALVLFGVWLAYGVRIRLLQALGAAITIFGVVFVATRGDPSAIGRLEFNRGDLIQVLGSMSYATFTVALRRRPNLPVFTFFIGFALAAFLTSLPLLGLEYAMGKTIWPGQNGLLALLYVAIFTSIVGHVFWMKAVEAIGPARAGVFQNLVPIVGAIFAVVFLREDFEWFHAVSLGLVLSGIFVSERGGRG